MYRENTEQLIAWKNKPNRKPLIIKGARQVGKSYLVTKLLGKEFKNVVELNFEKFPNLKSCFTPNLEAKEIIARIEIALKTQITPKETLLFFDEAQICPDSIISLRYFFEDLPELHVIAAGSLLDFILEDISIPVGRVEYLHCFPLSFEEFVVNSGHEKFLSAIKQYFPGPYDPTTHDLGLKLLQDYATVGGMPESVSKYLPDGKYSIALSTLKDLLETYEDDLPKYAKRRAEFTHVQTIFKRAPNFCSKNFSYADISRELSASQVRHSLDLLNKAGILSYIASTGTIPASIHAKINRFKFLFLDIGLLQQATRFDHARWLSESEVLLNDGTIAEQFIGQQIQAAYPPSKNSLYYWERDEKGSTAEVDYLLEINQDTVPIEVKSVAPGRLNSLRLFLEMNKNVPFGVRFCGKNSMIHDKLISIPHYAVQEFLRSVKELGVREFAGRYLKGKS